MQWQFSSLHLDHDLDFHMCLSLVLYQGHSDFFPYCVKLKTQPFIIIYAELIMHVE